MPILRHATLRPWRWTKLSFFSLEAVQCFHSSPCHSKKRHKIKARATHRSRATPVPSRHIGLKHHDSVYPSLDGNNNDSSNGSDTRSKTYIPTSNEFQARKARLRWGATNDSTPRLSLDDEPTTRLTLDTEKSEEPIKRNTDKLRSSPSSVTNSSTGRPTTAAETTGTISGRPTSFLYGEEARKARLVRLEQCEREKDIGHRFGSLRDSDVTIEPVEPLRHMHVAKLAHGLDRVLFNSGVHWLRDSRTGIYNFDPHLRDVLDVDLFDYGTLPPYLTSSRDPELLEITRRQKKKYCGSTSSMTGLLSHCYFLLSRWKEPELIGFSPSFCELPTGFSEGAKLPVSITLQHQPGGFYAIDADKNSAGEVDNTNYVLTSLGKSLEKFLTSTPDEYANHKRENSWRRDSAMQEPQEAYHYAQTSKLMLRSQLDCHDPRLPNGTFDLKTRAVVAIRNDRANYTEGCGYQIRFSHGLWESFEREYWDMVRAAFLKYNFQARIGHMDGIFVAYHNTAQIFGFQYISLEEMNLRLFGSNEMGDKAYRMSLGLLEQILDTATDFMPNETLSITMETRPGASSMCVIVQSVASSAIVQFEVTMDRYLNQALVRGPVNFSMLNGPLTHAQLEDVRCGRLENIANVDWHVQYCITPRKDLSEGKVRENLQEIRQRQRLMRSLCMPNIDLLNARESARIDTLSKHPEALERFLKERENGPAYGMPLAPGQRTTRQLIRSKALMDIQEHSSNKLPTAPIRWIRQPDPMTARLRELSRSGLARMRQEAKATTNKTKRVKADVANDQDLTSAAEPLT